MKLEILDLPEEIYESDIVEIMNFLIEYSEKRGNINFTLSLIGGTLLTQRSEEEFLKDFNAYKTSEGLYTTNGY